MNHFTNIPEELKQLPQWVCRKEKIPFNPVTGSPAKAGQPTTWARFENAVNAYENGGYDGIGFEFNKNGVVGIDLDHVIADDGSLSSEAVEILVMLSSYTEYSPSGKGLHIFVKGDIPVDGKKKGFIKGTILHCCKSNRSNRYGNNRKSRILCIRSRRNRLS